MFCGRSLFERVPFLRVQKVKKWARAGRLSVTSTEEFLSEPLPDDLTLKRNAPQVLGADRALERPPDFVVSRMAPWWGCRRWTTTRVVLTNTNQPSEKPLPKRILTRKI